jgi:ribosomal protein S2
MATQKEMEDREALRANVEEKLERLDEIKGEIKELVDEAGDLVREAARDVENGIIFRRAESYWLAHIESALDNEGRWLGGSMTKMQDTIDELREAIKPEEDDEEGEKSDPRD